MSADEIRELTDLSTPVMPEHWQATVMWPEQWDKIKAALLDYAAMVERCERSLKLHIVRLKEFRELGLESFVSHEQDIGSELDRVLHGDKVAEKGDKR